MTRADDDRRLHAAGLPLRPDPLARQWLDAMHPDPDPLVPTDVSDAYEDGYVAGVAHGIARDRKRDQLASVALAGAIVALLLKAFVVGRATAAPRTAHPTAGEPGASGAIGSVRPSAQVEASASGELSGAPLVRRALEPATAQDGPSPESPLVLAPMTGGAPPSPDVELGTAIESGLIAYAVPSHGDRYLALPGGPGLRVRICAGDRCLDRTSTDAGPALFEQRAGRIADVSFVDFAWLCRCDPPTVGLLVASIEYSNGPVLTAPPTDVTP